MPDMGDLQAAQAQIQSDNISMAIQTAQMQAESTRDGEMAQAASAAANIKN